MAGFADIGIVFDATSANAHKRHDAVLRAHGKTVVDPHARGNRPYTIPAVNGDANLDQPNVNMVTCGGQATIPIVAAVSRVAKVRYAEIVASIASKSAGPGTRANIDEFTETTGRAIVAVGGAERGKAIIILNPAEPPLIMRDTVYCMVDDCDPEAIAASVAAMVEEVRRYVPGYRLKQAVQFERIGQNRPLRHPREWRRAHRAQSIRVPRSRRRRALPAGLCRQSRHHDFRGPQDRGAYRAAPTRLSLRRRISLSPSKARSLLWRSIHPTSFTSRT